MSEQKIISEPMTMELFMEDSGKDVLIGVLFYMLDTQSLVNLSKCSKSLYAVTAAHRFHKRAMDERGASGIEGALANYQDILGKKSLKKLLTRTIKTRFDENDREDSDYVIDTLLQLAWRMGDVETCRIIKGYTDLIDSNLAYQQIKNLKRKSFNDVEALIKELASKPSVVQVSPGNLTSRLKAKIVDKFCNSIRNSSSFFDNFPEVKSGLKRAKLEVEIKSVAKMTLGMALMALPMFMVTLDDWPEQIVAVLLSLICTPIISVADFINDDYEEVLQEYRNGDREAPIPDSYTLKLLENINHEVKNDQKMFLDELGVDNDAQDPHENHEHNDGGKKPHKRR